MAPSSLLPMASSAALFMLLFLSETALGMRPLDEATTGKAALVQPAVDRASTSLRTTGDGRRLLANSFQPVTDALSLATTLVGASSLLVIDPASVEYTGAPSASGIFQIDSSHALDSEDGITTGVVLTTGAGDLSIVTTNDGEASSTDNGVPGDTLLSTINGDAATFDASVLDFKATAQSDGQLTFQYVFGSDEYKEFIGQFNDVFALFVKVGNGDFTIDDNVALAADGKYVSIDNVNPNNNAAQYVDNPADSATHHIAYDGYTTLLTTAPTFVSAGDSVHIRLSIADALDHLLDSAVYIVGKSIVIAPTPGPTPPAFSNCGDLCNVGSNIPNRCCNAEGTLGICCPGQCGPSTPNGDGTTNPTCLTETLPVPSPGPTEALQSCANDFCDPSGPLPNKCCNQDGRTMKCCPGQCGPNVYNAEGISTPSCE